MTRDLYHECPVAVFQDAAARWHLSGIPQIISCYNGVYFVCPITLDHTGLYIAMVCSPECLLADWDL